MCAWGSGGSERGGRARAVWLIFRVCISQRRQESAVCQALSLGQGAQSPAGGHRGLQLDGESARWDQDRVAGEGNDEAG